MAYVNPPRFAHGDQTASAANFNKYSEAIAWLYGALQGDNPALAQTPAVYDVTASDQLGFINTWRWLHYMTMVDDTVEITDPSGTGTPVSLPESEGAMAVYDLAGVSWLTPGQAYYVTGAAYAAEDRSA